MFYKHTGTSWEEWRCSFQRPLLSPPLHPLLYRSTNQAWIIDYFSGSRQRLFGSSPPYTYVWETQVFPETGLLPSFRLHTAFPLDQLYTFENGRERFANFHEHKDPLGCLFKMQIPLAQPQMLCLSGTRSITHLESLVIERHGLFKPPGPDTFLWESWNYYSFVFSLGFTWQVR